MAYVTVQEYASITGDTAPADFSALSNVADTIIDAHTLYGLVGRTITALPELVKQKVKEAAAYQIQYMNNCGGLSALNTTEYGSVTVGKLSYSVSDGSTGNEAPLSPMLDTCLDFVCAYLRGLGHD